MRMLCPLALFLAHFVAALGRHRFKSCPSLGAAFLCGLAAPGADQIEVAVQPALLSASQPPLSSNRGRSPSAFTRPMAAGLL
jgi:hypothetical protein